MSSNIFFTSDTHYYHSNIIKYCNRPFSSIEEMNEKMINNHNSIIKPKDQVFFLGDFAFGKLDRNINILSRLNGVKHLIMGNHDDDIRKNISNYSVDNLFISISDYKELKINGTIICMNHYAQRVWHKSYKGSCHLFGHSHGTLPPYGKSVDVGVDSAWITGKAEFRPFNLDEVISFISKRELEKDQGLESLRKD